MKKLIFILTISVLCVSGCLSRSSSYHVDYDYGSIDKVAIVAIRGEVQNQNAKDQISDMFMRQLIQKGYAPIPLAQVNAQVQMMADSNTPLEIPDNAYVQVGQALKIPAILVVNVPYFDEEISITAQLIETKQGSVLWMDYDSGKSGFQNAAYGPYGNQDAYLMDPLLMSQGDFQQQEMTLRPGESSLTPVETQKISAIVSRICSSLPPRVSASKTEQAAPILPLTRKTPRTTNDNDW